MIIAALENHLWQSTVFCCVVALLMLMLRRNRAAVRHGLWLAASVKFLVPLSVVASLAGQVEWHKAQLMARPRMSVVEQVSQPFAAPDAAPLLAAVPTAPNRLPAILFGAWLCGFVMQCLAWWQRWRRVQAALRGARPVDLGLPVRTLSTRWRLEPGVFGVFRPSLVLPAGIEEHLPAAQFEAMLAHELCHVRRRDNLAAAIHMVVEALFWFHPLVWWIEARLVEERERACDEEVLRTADDPQDYAEGIVAVCKLYVKAPVACVSGITGSNLGRRVEAIMLNHDPRRLDFGRRMLLASAGFAAVIVPLAVGALHPPAIRAQQPATPLEFDAVSVKPSDPKSRQGTVVSVTAGGTLHVVNATLKDLIETAYDVRVFQIEGGPKWAGSDKYDVDATPGPRLQGAAPPPGWTTVRFKVQTLLKERFQLQLRRESRTLPIYSLGIAKGGVKSSAVTAAQGSHRGITAGPASMMGEAASMKDLAYKLSRLLLRPVVDDTGLDGNFDFRLEWAPDAAPAAPDGRPVEAAGPSVFSALQAQLGLRLESTKGPVDVLVIGRVERPPEN